MIAIVDYGVGNLFSLISSFKSIGVDVTVTSDPSVLEIADGIILPGVGAFSDAMKKLSETGLDRVVKELVGKGKRMMGICLGMQLLFEKSYEYGEYDGLCLLKGSVVPMRDEIPKGLMIPHIGWNRVTVNADHPIYKYVKAGDYVYFVHSYFVKGCEDSLLSTTDYGIPITAAVAKGNLAGTQFHPEKSGEVGLSILRAFAEWCEEEKGKSQL